MLLLACATPLPQHCIGRRHSCRRGDDDLEHAMCHVERNGVMGSNEDGAAHDIHILYNPIH